MTSSAALVRPLHEFGAADRGAAGGKGASLGEMSQAGLPVPAGFVVTAQAFELASPGTSRAAIRAAPTPEILAAEIAAAYQRLSDREGLGDDPPVAVRSSAVGEDSADASFAGLQDTYLWVRGTAAVLEHVRWCWASLYNDEAVSYREHHGEQHAQPVMAVVVQLMVDPRAAGVMFTLSPTTGDRSVVAIEGSWGLGSILVSGEVTPDSFVVSKVTGGILRREVGPKLRRHRAAPGSQGTITEDVPHEMRERPCLIDDEIRALARLGRKVERHYGIPQDIEWAITDDGSSGSGSSGAGNIVLLQSRAETVWSSRRAAPLAVPKARPMDHVFEQLARVVPGSSVSPQHGP